MHRHFEHQLLFTYDHKRPKVAALPTCSVMPWGFARLAECTTSSVESRSLADTPDTRPKPWNTFDLDGTSDTSDPTADRRRASASQADEPTRTEKALSQPTQPHRPRGQTVADRISVFDEILKAAALPSREASPSIDGPRSSKHKVSLAASRVSSFVRRDAASNPVGIDPPLMKSRTPLRSPRIHAPSPTAQALAFSALEEGLAKSGSSLGDKRAGTVQSVLDRPPSQSGATAHDVIQPSPGLEAVPGTPYCHRHGRKLGKRKGAKEATAETMERSLNGAYIPSGIKIRHQVESTSPWHVYTRHLTKSKGTAISPDICFDCAAEQHIRTREDLESARVKAAANGVGSTDTEPGTPPTGHHDGISLIGLTADNQSVNIPGAALSGYPAASAPTLTAADLGGMIDAIIIEHKGELDRVITNLRDGTPGPLKLQGLSKDLARVSGTIASTDGNRCTMLPDHAPGGSYSIILDTPPDFLRSRTKSIPDLLDYIDSAARDLGLDTGRNDTTKHSSVEREVDRQPQRPVLRRDSVPLLLSSASNRSLAPENAISKQLRANSAYATANPSPAESPTLEVKSPPLEAIVPVPGAMPVTPPAVEMQPLQRMQSIPETPVPRSILRVPTRSDSLPAKLDSQAAPLASEPGSSSSVIPGGQFSAPPDVSAGPATRIPERRNTGNGAATERKYLPGAVKMPLATYNKPQSNRPVPLKPSEVKQSQRQQGTFAPPWIREMSKDVSLKERLERRARMGADPSNS